MRGRAVSHAPARPAPGLAVTALCACALLAPALINRGPFVYFDTAGYLGQADGAVRLLGGRLGMGPDPTAGAPGAPALGPEAADGVVTAGRSIYYGLLAWAGTEAAGPLAVAALQALAMAALVVMAARAVRPGASAAAWAATSAGLAAGLALLTSAGFFAGLIMPDVWAGLMILALALLLARWEALEPGARAALWAVMALSVLFHASHLLLLAALAGLLALAAIRPRWRRRLAPRRLALPAAAVLCGVLGQLAYALAITEVTGQPPLPMPHVTAHLVDMGPGARLARETCPESGYAICPFADRLPTDWTAFLFSRDPARGVFKVAAPEIQRALADEQARFALDTLRAEPLATLGGLAGDGVAQLWHLSVDDVPLTRSSEAFLADNFAPALAALVRASAIWDRPGAAPALTRLIQAGMAASVAGLLAMGLAGRLPRHGPAATILAVCLAGVVLNALICGALASPYGRFQARVAWLPPFLLALMILSAVRPDRKPTSDHA